MIAVILVAGNSRRMGELTADRHKSMLDAGGKPILTRLINALVSEDVTEVCLVCGSRKEELKKHIAGEFPAIQATWIENPVYAETNTGYSLWLTREELLSRGEDILLINGDVVLDHRCIAVTLAAEGETVLAARCDRVGEEEVKFRLDRDGRICEIGKHIPPAQARGESIGVNRLSARLLPKLYDTLEKGITEGVGRREFYENTFNRLIREGEIFRIADITHLPVMEVDTPDDYREMLREIVPRLEE